MFDTGRSRKKWRTAAEYITGLNVPVYAAHAGYFMILALFPMLVLLLSLLRYTGIAVQSFTDALEGMIPQALMPAARRLIYSTYQNTSGAVVSVSAVTALWSAGRGVYGLRKGLNAIYRVPESRGYFYTRAVSVVYTLLFLLVLLLTLTLGIFGTSLSRFIPMGRGSRYVLLLVIQTALFTAIYVVLPNRKNRLTDSLPGAVLASVGWLGFSNLYTVYVQHFTGYANIYGSVYAVAVSMLWLYCCISIIFYGGALNQYLQGKNFS